jgi:hypothetical protein
MTRRTGRWCILLCALTSAHCGASTYGERDASAGMDVVSEPVDDAAASLPDSLDDIAVFEDGAECRTENAYWDCFRLYAHRLQPQGVARFVCCAGRCFQGLSCRVEDPSQAICDLSEAPCDDTQVCCFLRSTSGRAQCQPRSNLRGCLNYSDGDAGE